MRTLCQKSGSVGLEAQRAQVVARGEANVGVEGSSQTAEQGDGRLGAALLDALNLINAHPAIPASVGEAAPFDCFGRAQPLEFADELSLWSHRPTQPLPRGNGAGRALPAITMVRREQADPKQAG
jgi:hypothetical protein